MIRWQKHGHARGRNGGRKSPTYLTWLSMNARCRPNCSPDVRQKYYDRGIRVCERWSDFKNFLEDMGERPKGKTLDRIDNNGNYEPSNCRWATIYEQQSNRRSIRIITYRGETRSLTEWAKVVGLKPGTITARLNKGWPEGQALGFVKRPDAQMISAAPMMYETLRAFPGFNADSKQIVAWTQMLIAAQAKAEGSAAAPSVSGGEE